MSDEESLKMSGAVAARHLGKFGIVDPTLIEAYYTRGGTFLGLELLRRNVNVDGLSLPQDAAFPIQEIKRISAEDVLVALPSTLIQGFAVKYSGTNESFSPNCKRGKNSSRRRFWDGAERTDALRLIQDSIENAPSSASTIIFQQYIKEPRMSGVFYAYAHAGKTIVESNSSGLRCVSLIKDGVVVSRSLVSGEHVRASSYRQADVRKLDRTLQTLRSRLGFDLDVEGFEFEGEVILVQLRPIPDDVPRSSPQGVGLALGSGWHPTLLAWGSWNHGRARLNADVPGRPAIMLKREDSLTKCQAILRRLDLKYPTLVVDVVDGFRLSHHPDNLPEDLTRRQNFAYISVVDLPLMQIREGDLLEVLIYDDYGRIRQLHE